MNLILENICSIIVTYDPDLEVLSRVLAAASFQTDFVLIVDNASTNISGIEDMIKNFSRVTILRNKFNKGLAAALNYGIHFALNHINPSWFLILDQDSILDLNAVKTMRLRLEHHPSISSVGIIHIAYHTNPRDNVPPLVSKKYVINSGSIVLASIYSQVKYRNEFFVDAIDFDFCYSVRHIGYEILESSNGLMTTQFGEGIGRFKSYSTKRLFGVTRNMTILLLEGKVNLVIWGLLILDMFRASLRGNSLRASSRTTIYALLEGIAYSLFHSSLQDAALDGKN